MEGENGGRGKGGKVGGFNSEKKMFSSQVKEHKKAKIRTSTSP